MRLKSKLILILDFDGIVLESNGIKDNALREIFSDFPQQFNEIWNYHTQNNSVDRYTKFKFILKNFLNRSDDNVLYQSWLNRFQEYTRNGMKQCSFVPGAAELLKDFHNKMPLYLSSATPQEELDWIIDTRNLRYFFKKVYGYPPKKPATIREILEREDATAEEALFIGDSLDDWTSAQDVGVRFIGRKGWSSFDGMPFPVFPDLMGIKSYIEQNNFG